MSAMKAYCEEVSAGLGYGGEINDHALSVAARLMGDNVPAEDAERAAEDVKDEFWIAV